MVKLLLEKGANPSAKDANGKTAAAYADEKGFRGVKDLLQQKMAPANKPIGKEEKKPSSDQPQQGKRRLGAVSPDAKPATQAGPPKP